jgi:hypothetical protein
MRQGESDRAHSSSSTFRNYTHSESRFRAVLSEGASKQVELVRLWEMEIPESVPRSDIASCRRTRRWRTTLRAPPDPEAQRR